MNLLIPAEAVATLHIPPRAITTGEPDPVWCSVRVGWRRQRIRLPYDRASAANLRLWRRLGPIAAVFFLGAAAFVTVRLFRGQDLPRGFTLSYLVLVALIVLGHPKRKPPAPVQSAPDRAVYLRGVRDDVAAEWIAANPGVRSAARRRSPIGGSPP